MSDKKIQFIKDIAAGDEIDSLFLLSQANLSQARNGPFWRLELKDNSGALEAKIWSPMSQAFSELSAGSIVRVGGRATLYREKLDLNIETFAVLSPEEQAGLDMTDFLHASSKQPQDMLDELMALCRKTLLYPPWKKFVFSVLKDEFIQEHLPSAPAAKGVHHAYYGGLLEHTLSVANLCMLLADNYPELDRQLLLAGAICHDLGKLWELKGGAVVDYTNEGRLLGHIELGLEVLDPYLRKAGLEPELTLHFKHLILSHHGELEFGSPKRPKTAEAFVLHFADNIDARLAQFKEVVGAMPEDGPEWSPFQATLGRFLFRASPTPALEAKEKTKSAKAAKSSEPLPMQGFLLPSGPEA